MVYERSEREVSIVSGRSVRFRVLLGGLARQPLRTAPDAT